MSLTPALPVNFDGAGLSADDDYVTDAAGVGHFHPVKAGATWQFDLVFTGTDTTALTWTMDVRRSRSEATPLLSTSGSGVTAIGVTPNPTGSDPERVRFTISAAATGASLQSNGAGISFVFDIFAGTGSERDRWVEGTGIVTPAVTLAS